MDTDVDAVHQRSNSIVRVSQGQYLQQRKIYINSDPRNLNTGYVVDCYTYLLSGLR
jgi:hypothetical protein